MTRMIVGGCIGAICGMCALAGFGVWAGFVHGGPWVGRAGIPPGAYAAALGAFVYLAYFWWLAAGVGSIIGALAGLGSWLVRPKGIRDL